MPEPIQLDGKPEKGQDASIKIDFTPVAKTEDSFENIFSQSSKKEKESKMMSSIVEQKEALNKTKPILGSAPILEKTIEQEKISRQKRKLHLVQFIFVALFMAGLGGAFYFYSELSPAFDLLGANTTHKLTDVNTSLRKLQTDSNKYRYLSIQLDLNDFSYQADRFFGNIHRLTDATDAEMDQEKVVSEIELAKKAMPSLLANMRLRFNKNFVVPTFRTEAEKPQSTEEIQQQFEQDLRKALTEDRNKLVKANTPEDLQNVKLIDNSLKLVGNKALVLALQKISIDNFSKDLNDYQQQPDPQKEKALRDLIGKLLATTQSDLATIATIKQQRIEWSTIIGQIESETINIDKNYGQPLLYENLGGIVYSGYEFDAASNKIVLSGTTKTSDGSNFTLISNLIDQLEQSAHFEDVEMRSFSKNKTTSNGASEGYVANFKIDLRLEPRKYSDKDKTLSLEDGQSNTVTNGVKR